MTRRLVPAALLLALLAGCGTSATSSSTPTATVPSPAPSGGQTLRDVGFVHGPATFWLPAGVVPVDRIDEPNVVTLTLGSTDGTRAVGWIAAHLSAMGFTTDAARGSSLVFHDATWRGAWTCSTTVCALTLRQQ